MAVFIKLSSLTLMTNHLYKWKFRFTRYCR